ncbi:hypothetical protein AO501_24505 [Mycobacterium gordonae]|uniref:Uncharacterized protein n=1 Tax=Mycobacterium gordonae TaxID=1778 RepID=A0A0Q2Q5U8_MYCGO|nr:hypothetical protein AO501_24505 [Mycobacterium gordonae]
MVRGVALFAGVTSQVIVRPQAFSWLGFQAAEFIERIVSDQSTCDLHGFDEEAEVVLRLQKTGVNDGGLPRIG